MGENIDARFGKGLGDEGWKNLDQRPKFPGIELVIGNKEYISAYTHGALTYGYPYMIDYGTTKGQEFVTAAPADTGTLFLRVVVPYRDEAAGVLAWLQTRGAAQSLSDKKARKPKFTRAKLVNIRDFDELIRIAKNRKLVTEKSGHGLSRKDLIDMIMDYQEQEVKPK